MITIDARYSYRGPQVGDMFISNITVQDEGAFGERKAPPGQFGQILAIRSDRNGDDVNCEVAFFPSGIANYWTGAEIRAYGELLAPDDRRRPLETHQVAVVAFDSLLDDTNTTTVDGKTLLIVRPEQRAVLLDLFDRAIAEWRSIERSRGPSRPSATSDQNISVQAGATLGHVRDVLAGLDESGPATPSLTVSEVNRLASALGIAERMTEEGKMAPAVTATASAAASGNPIRSALDALISDLSAQRANPHAADSPSCTADEVIFWHADQVRSVLQSVGRFVQRATAAVSEEMSAEQKRAIDALGASAHEFSAPPRLAADLYSGPQSALAEWVTEVEENCMELRRIHDDVTPAPSSAPAP